MGRAQLIHLLTNSVITITMSTYVAGRYRKAALSRLIHHEERAGRLDTPTSDSIEPLTDPEDMSRVTLE